MKKKITGIQVARRITLGFFLLLTTVLPVLHQRLSGFPAVDAFCPFGGLEGLYSLVAGGEMLRRLQTSNVALLISITVLGVLLGRFFCGWICALGALQALFGRLGAFLFKKRFSVPEKLDRVLRYGKYVALVAILAASWATASLVIRPYDPWAAYAHLSSGFGELLGEFAAGFAILVITLLGSLFIDRPFCKYLCPLGAFNALLSRIPLFRIRREKATCISCTQCDRICPMNIRVMEKPSVDSAECIGCFECVTTCPTKKGTLRGFLFSRPMKLAFVACLGLFLYLAPIAIGRASGLIQFNAASLEELAHKERLSVEDIKGSSTWAEVSSSFGIGLEALYREAGVDPGLVPPATRLKDSGILLGKDFEAEEVREAVKRLLK